MQAGQLDQQITFQSETRTPDGGGGYTTDWTVVATTWARVLPLRGREQIEAMGVEASNMYRITIRNRADIDTDMHIVWAGLTLNIREAPYPGGREMYREIMAEVVG